MHHHRRYDFFRRQHIDVATELKQRKANRIFAAATFGLFTNGMEKFDKAYETVLFTVSLRQT